MATNFDITTIKSDQYAIKDQLIQLLQSDLSLQGTDLTKSGYLAYIIDALSIMSANLLWFSSMNYKEGFLVSAQLSESVFNWASYLSYTPPNASPSYVNNLVSVPLEFTDEILFSIPKDHGFYSDEVNFLTANRYDIYINPDNGEIKISEQSDTEKRSLPYDITDNVLSFFVTLVQEAVKEEEFVSPALSIFQFFILNIDFNDYLYNIRVFITEPGKVEEEWDVKDSIFLMPAGDKNFTYKKIAEQKVQVILGNGIFGKQPLQNSKIRVVIETTKGEDGRVALGFVKTADKIFITQNGVSKEVAFTTINPDAGYGGKNSETVDETRQNAIIQNTSRQRIVSETDYSQITSIVKDLPIISTRQVLKRSDIKINEICMFNVIGNDTFGVVESTSEKLTLPLATTFVKPYNTFSIPIGNGEYSDYYNPFGFSVDETNEAVEYFYQITNATYIPNVFNVNIDNYPVSFINLDVFSDETYDNVVIQLFYTIGDVGFAIADVTANFVINYENETLGPYTMESVEELSTFAKTLPVSDLKKGVSEIEIKLFYQGTYFATVTAEVTILQNLNGYMISFYEEDATDRIIYDVPLISKKWYDALEDKESFERNIIQQLLLSFDLTKKYRMMNTFINLKLAKTSGLITSLNYNSKRFDDIVSAFVNDPPTGIPAKSKYIVGPEPTGEWIGHSNEVAEWLANDTWFYHEPVIDSYVYVEDVEKTYVYTPDLRWLEPIIQSPIYIEAVVTTGINNDPAVVQQKVIDTIVEGTKEMVGLSPKIYRSALIKMIQELRDDVIYCELKYPLFNIEFTIDVTKLTAQELIEYVPEYVYISPDNIKVIVKKERLS